MTAARKVQLVHDGGATVDVHIEALRFGAVDIRYGMAGVYRAKLVDGRLAGKARLWRIAADDLAELRAEALGASFRRREPCQGISVWCTSIPRIGHDDRMVRCCVPRRDPLWCVTGGT